MALEDPPSEEPKSERFNMFISKSEMAAIDDWAWQHRIRSKSEAVRRLIQIGIRAPDMLMEVGDSVQTSVASANQLTEAWSALAKMPDSGDEEEDAQKHSEAYRNIIDASEKLVDDTGASLGKVSDVLFTFVQFLTSDKLEEQIANANRLADKTAPMSSEERKLLRETVGKKLRGIEE